MTEINFTYRWQDGDIIGDLKFTCPKCGTEHIEEVSHIEEEITCEKCFTKFAFHQKQWLDVLGEKK